MFLFFNNLTKRRDTMFSKNSSPKETTIKAITENDSEVTFAHFGPSPMKFEEISKISEGLKTNRYITHISFHDCRLTEKMIQKLAEGIMKNSSLHAVGIDFSDDASDALKKVKAAIEAHLKANQARESNNHTIPRTAG